MLPGKGTASSPIVLSDMDGSATETAVSPVKVLYGEKYKLVLAS